MAMHFRHAYSSICEAKQLMPMLAPLRPRHVLLAGCDLACIYYMLRSGLAVSLVRVCRMQHTCKAWQLLVGRQRS